MKWRQLATEQAAREVREGALVNAGLKKLSLAVGLRSPPGQARPRRVPADSACTRCITPAPSVSRPVQN